MAKKDKAAKKVDEPGQKVPKQVARFQAARHLFRAGETLRVNLQLFLDSTREEDANAEHDLSVYLAKNGPCTSDRGVTYEHYVDSDGLKRVRVSTSK